MNMVKNVAERSRARTSRIERIAVPKRKKCSEKIRAESEKIIVEQSR